MYWENWNCTLTESLSIEMGAIMWFLVPNFPPISTIVSPSSMSYVFLPCVCVFDPNFHCLSRRSSKNDIHSFWGFRLKSLKPLITRTKSMMSFFSHTQNSLPDFFSFLIFLYVYVHKWSSSFVDRHQFWFHQLLEREKVWEVRVWKRKTILSSVVLDDSSKEKKQVLFTQ